MCQPSRLLGDPEHQSCGITTIKGRKYLTLACVHRVLVRADVGRIDTVQANRSGERHIYLGITRASAHRFKQLAGDVKNECLRDTRRAGLPTMSRRGGHDG